MSATKRNETQGDAGGLSRQAARYLAALLEHGTVTKAAEACGVNASTIFRWLQNEDFKREYESAQRAVAEGAIRKLQGATDKAVDALIENLTSENPFAKNTAAQAILAHAFKGIELQDLQSEINEIKRLLAERETGGKGKGLREAGT